MFIVIPAVGITVLMFVSEFGSLSANEPWKANCEAPLLPAPSVIIYLTVMIVLFSNFLPKYPSPNNNSYFSS